MFIPFSTSSIATSTLTVGTTATAVASEAVASHQRAGRNAVIVANTGESAVYFGGEDVTTSTGIPIVAGESVAFPVNSYNSEKAVYVVAAASTTVNIAELFD